MLYRLFIGVACGLALTTLSACKTADLYTKASRGLDKYETHKDHKAFVVYESYDGGYAWTIAGGRPSRKIAYEHAKRRCEEGAQNYNFFSIECKPYMIDDVKVYHFSPAEIEKVLNEKTTPASPKKFSWIKFSGSWHGVDDKTVGHAQAIKAKTSTLISLKINDELCAGLMQPDNKQTPGMKSGTWNVSCPSDLSASGDFIYTDKGEGYADGIDSQGHSVELTIDPKVPFTPL